MVWHESASLKYQMMSLKVKCYFNASAARAEVICKQNATIIQPINLIQLVFKCMALTVNSFMIHYENTI